MRRGHRSQAMQCAAQLHVASLVISRLFDVYTQQSFSSSWRFRPSLVCRGSPSTHARLTTISRSFAPFGGKLELGMWKTHVVI
jgi:hypothetical protein